MKILNTTDKNKCNCVLWLRDRLPELPTGLWTLDDKEAIINSQTPVVGSGAMCADGVWFTHEGKKVFSGHVALVTKVKDDLLTIQEANYKSCTITEREGTKDKLKIVGFFVPERLKNMDKTYRIKSELRNELKTIWNDFNHEDPKDHDKMADRLHLFIDLAEQDEKMIDDLHKTIEARNEELEEANEGLTELTKQNRKLITGQDLINSAHDKELLEQKEELTERFNGLLETQKKIISTTVNINSSYADIALLFINKLKQKDGM
ncbi:MAG: hypothetical protein OEV44_11085 [Spirochaetota bacterium]|nr:hypothetical protein [Spirochaetota bacterium]